jgi:hypothetical protein
MSCTKLPFCAHCLFCLHRPLPFPSHVLVAVPGVACRGDTARPDSVDHFGSHLPHPEITAIMAGRRGMRRGQRPCGNVAMLLAKRMGHKGLVSGQVPASWQCYSAILAMLLSQFGTTPLISTHPSNPRKPRRGAWPQNYGLLRAGPAIFPPTRSYPGRTRPHKVPGGSRRKRS